MRRMVVTGFQYPPPQKKSAAPRPVDTDRIVLNQVTAAIRADKPDDEIVKAACEAVRHIPMQQQKISLILATIQAADQWVTEHLEDRRRRFPDFLPTW